MAVSLSLPSALDLDWFSPASARTVDGRLAWVPIHWGAFNGSLSSTRPRSRPRPKPSGIVWVKVMAQQRRHGLLTGETGRAEPLQDQHVCWVKDERLHLKGSHRGYPDSRVRRAMLSGNRPPIHSLSLTMRQWAPEPRTREARPVCPSETRLKFSSRRVFLH